MPAINIGQCSWRNTKEITIYDLDNGERNLEKELKRLQFSEDQSEFISQLVDAVINHFDLEIRSIKKTLRSAGE